MSTHSIYRSPEGRAEIQAIYDRQVERLGFATESRTLPTRFGSTHVLVAGRQEARPLVCLQGGNTTNPVTLQWIQPLLEKFRVYAPDTVGHPGRSAETRLSTRDNSYGQWVVDLLDGLQLERPAVMGGSFGAGILLRAAAYAPQRLGPAVLFIPSGIVSIPLATMIFKLVIPLLSYRLNPSRAGLLRALRPMLGEQTNEDILEITAAVFKHVRIEAEMPRNATHEELAGFTAPTLVIAAEKDELFPAGPVLARARQLFPNLVATECLPGSTHFLPPPAQAELCRQISHFLKQN